MRVPVPLSIASGIRIRMAVAFAGVGLVAVCTGAWFVRADLRTSLATLGDVDARTAAWAASAFAVSLFASACAWQLAFAAVGSRMTRAEACASYSVGSLVNTFVPASLGEGVRAVLFGRALPDDGARALTTAGAMGAVAIARTLSQVVLLTCAVLLAGFPRWLVLLPASFLVVAVAAMLVFRGRPSDSRLGRLAGAGATLVRRPAFGLRVVGFTAAATAARLAAATAIASALGIDAPLRAGLVMVAALALAAAVPITPGSIGITSGAISLVLAQRGVPMTSAVAAGVLFHAVESAVSVTLGLISTPFVMRPGLGRRPLVRVAMAGAGLVVFAALGAALVTRLPVTEGLALARSLTA